MVWYREPIRALICAALTALWNPQLSLEIQIPPIRPAVIKVRKENNNEVILASSSRNLVSYVLVQNSWSVVIGFEMRPLFAPGLMQSKCMLLTQFVHSAWIHFTLLPECGDRDACVNEREAVKKCLWMRSSTSLSYSNTAQPLHQLVTRECQG